MDKGVPNKRKMQQATGTSRLNHKHIYTAALVFSIRVPHREAGQLLNLKLIFLTALSSKARLLVKVWKEKWP